MTTKFNPGRWLIVLCLFVLLFLNTGCRTNPVPANRIEIKTPRGSYQIATPKNVDIVKFKASVDTNGTVDVAFDKWTSTNDPEVVGKSYAGQALVIKTAFEGANQFAEKLVQGGVKGMKGGANARKLDVDDIALERVEGRVCESLDDVDGVDSAPTDPLTHRLSDSLLAVPPLRYFHIAHGKIFAGLNARFTRGTLRPSDTPFVWTLNQVNLLRPDLRGTDRESTWLTLRRLGTATNNTNPDFPEWCVRNRAGYPVKMEPRIMRGEINFLTESTPADYTLYTEHFAAFDRVSIIVQDGHWLFQTRAKDMGLDWQPLRSLVPGQTYVQSYEADFLPHDYRVIRAMEALQTF